jgi:hypothetical protein
MSSDVFVPEHAVRIVFVYQSNELVEGGIEGSKIGWSEGVGFGPVRTAFERGDDGLEAGEVFAVRSRLSVRSTRKDIVT